MEETAITTAPAPKPNGKAPAPPAPKDDVFDLIETVGERESWALVVYGEKGVGKTTFATGAPNPLVLALNDRSLPGNAVRTLKTYADLRRFLTGLRDKPAGIPFQTLVIDMAEEVDAMIVEYVCRRDHGKVYNNKGERYALMDGDRPILEGYDFGKGGTYVAQEWMNLLALLDEIRRKHKIHVIFTAHAAIRKKKNADGPEFTALQPSFTPAAVEAVDAWADGVLFAGRQTDLVADVVVGGPPRPTKPRGQYGIERFLHSDATEGHFAKNRWWLPLRLELSWAAFETVVRFNTAENGARGRARLEEELARLPVPADAAKVIRAELARLAPSDATGVNRLLRQARSFAPAT